jgi:hypothetical protein
MYTIDELESTVLELEANKGHQLLSLDIMAALTEDSHVIDVMSQLLDTMRENARLRTALEWYADDSNYSHPYDFETDSYLDSPVERDDGQRARVALKGD